MTAGDIICLKAKFSLLACFHLPRSSRTSQQWVLFLLSTITAATALRSTSFNLRARVRIGYHLAFSSTTNQLVGERGSLPVAACLVRPETRCCRTRSEWRKFAGSKLNDFCPDDGNTEQLKWSARSRGLSFNSFMEVVLVPPASLEPRPSQSEASSIGRSVGRSSAGKLACRGDRYVTRHERAATAAAAATTTRTDKQF